MFVTYRMIGIIFTADLVDSFTVTPAIDGC